AGAFELAFILHSFAAVAIGLYTLTSARQRAALFVSLRRFGAQLFWPVLASGVLIFANHGFFYYALAESEKFDVTAILIFETWPIIYFLIANYRFKTAGARLNSGDYLMVFFSFAGFFTLMLQEIDLADWLLFDSTVFTVAAYAALGGLAMTANVFARLSAMRVFSDADGAPRLPEVDGFRAALVVEILVRVLASLFFYAVFIGVDGEYSLTAPSDLALALFVGALSLGVGSALYDLAVFRARNAALSALWYLMPVISLIVLAVIEVRLLNEYEAIALVLIVSANILISLQYPLNSSFTLFYVFTIVIGYWCVFVPGSGFDEYFALISVSTFFYALLGTYALTRIAENAREKETQMQRFREALRAARDEETEPAAGRAVRDYAASVAQLLSQEDAAAVRVAETRRDIEARKAAVASGRAGGGAATRLFEAGDRLLALLGDKISGGEYVVMTMLAALNVGVIVALRGDGLAFDIFALTVASAAAYLLFLIYERDRQTLSQFGHVFVLANILELVRPAAGGGGGEGPAPEGADAAIARRQQNFLSSLFVFAFLFGGLVYALSYQSLAVERRPERAPVGETTASAATLREIGIAAPNWPSARIKAEVLREVASRYLAYDVTLHLEDNEEIFRSMGAARGVIDVHPEVWVENVPSLTRRYVDALGSVALSPIGAVGRQGLCFNRAAAAAGAPAGIQALDAAEAARLFDLDGDGRGEIWIGAPDWSSTEIERVRAEAYGYAERFDLLAFDEELLLAALARYERDGRPFLFFCYRPNFAIDGYVAGQLAEGAFDAEAWRAITRAAARGAPAPASGAAARGAPWPETRIRVAYSARLERTAPNMVRLLRNFSAPEEVVNAWSRAVAEEGRAPAEVAKEWVAANEETVLDWVLP
ncbi:MAG: glycine betaine ABC transporter substrate-binding protein, partial [Pseudomonadota bacterium]